jgi:Tfp pilus assembly protein PilE
MPFTETNRSKKLTAVIVVGIVVAVFLAIKYESYVQFKKAATRHYDTVEAVLVDVERLGGQLIHCQGGVCTDRANGKTLEIDEPRDGNYLVYPPNSKVPADVIRHQGEEIKRLTQDEHQS